VVGTASVTGYANIFKSRLLFDRAASIAPVRQFGELYSATAGGVDMDPIVTGGLVEEFPSPAPTPFVAGADAIAFASNLDVFLGVNGTKSIRRFTMNGTELTARTGLTSPPVSLVVTGNYVLFTDLGNTVLFYNYQSMTTTSTLFAAGAGSQLTGLALDSSGNLYIADSGRRVIHRMTAAQVSSALGGTAVNGPLVYAGALDVNGTTDGTLSGSRFNQPRALAFDSTGNLYVADIGNKDIRKITTGGSVVTLPGPQVAYNGPLGLAWGGDALFVTDVSTTVIYRIAPGGVPEIFAGKLSTSGSFRGLVKDTLFSNPKGIGMDPRGFLYIGDATSVTRVVPSCPVSLENQPSVPSKSFPAGLNCDFFFGVFSGGSNLVGASPILKTRLNEGSNSGFHTQELTGPAYSPAPNFTGEGFDLVYDASDPNPSLAISKSGVTSAPWNATWVLPDSGSYANQTLVRLMMKSDAGITNSSVDVTLASGSITVPRKISGAPIREFEAVYQALNTVSGNIEYLKQRFRFKPVVPANVVTRLYMETSLVGNGFTINTNCTNWYFKAFFSGSELPIAISSSGVFAGVGKTADTAGLVYVSSSEGALSIINAKAKFRTIEADKDASGLSISGTVSLGGGTCSISNIGAVN
jgi:sugar lactone lactonase YvrE